MPVAASPSGACLIPDGLLLGGWPIYRYGGLGDGLAFFLAMLQVLVSLVAAGSHSLSS